MRSMLYMAKAARPYGVKYEQMAIPTMRPSNLTGRIAIAVMLLLVLKSPGKSQNENFV